MLLKRCYRLRFVAVFLSVVVFISCTLPCFTRKANAEVIALTAAGLAVAAAVASAAGLAFAENSMSSNQAINDYVSTDVRYVDMFNTIGDKGTALSDGRMCYEIGTYYSSLIWEYVTGLYKHFCGVGESVSIPVSYETKGGYYFDTAYMSYSGYVPSTVIPSSSCVYLSKNGTNHNAYATVVTSDAHMIMYTYDASSASWTAGNNWSLGSIDTSKPYGFYCDYNTSGGHYMYFRYFKIGSTSATNTNTYSYFANYSSTLTTVRSFNGYTYADGSDVAELLNWFKSSALDAIPYPLVLNASPVTVTKDVEVKNTIPVALDGETVANEIEEKVASGDCAAVIPADGVDITLPFDLQDYLQTGVAVKNPDIPADMTGVSLGLTSIIDLLRQILSKIIALPTTLMNALLALLKYLFVPAEGYFNDLFMPLRNKFNFVNDIIGASVIFKNFFNNTDFSQPPKLIVDFGKANSKYKYGGQTAILDASFYTPYKSYVDVFLSSLFWVLFLWSIFRSLSSIIKGEETRKYKENSDNKG